MGNEDQKAPDTSQALAALRKKREGLKGRQGDSVRRLGDISKRGDGKREQSETPVRQTAWPSKSYQEMEKIKEALEGRVSHVEEVARKWGALGKDWSSKLKDYDKEVDKITSSSWTGESAAAASAAVTGFVGEFPDTFSEYASSMEDRMAGLAANFRFVVSNFPKVDGQTTSHTVDFRTLSTEYMDKNIYAHNKITNPFGWRWGMFHESNEAGRDDFDVLKATIDRVYKATAEAAQLLKDSYSTPMKESVQYVPSWQPTHGAANPPTAPTPQPGPGSNTGAGGAGGSQGGGGQGGGGSSSVNAPNMDKLLDKMKTTQPTSNPSSSKSPLEQMANMANTAGQALSSLGSQASQAAQQALSQAQQAAQKAAQDAALKKNLGGLTGVPTAHPATGRPGGAGGGVGAGKGGGGAGGGSGAGSAERLAERTAKTGATQQQGTSKAAVRPTASVAQTGQAGMAPGAGAPGGGGKGGGGDKVHKALKALRTRVNGEAVMGVETTGATTPVVEATTDTSVGADQSKNS